MRIVAFSGSLAGGFRCPACGHDRAWELATKAWTFECAKCRRQTSVTAGTVMHGSKLPLTVWFWAAYLMATHSNGLSARQLGLGSYKSAWLLRAKLRRAMVNPARALLSGVVEIDETAIPHRTRPIRPVADKDAAPTARCSSPRRWNVEAGAIAKTDGWSAYTGAPGVNHDPHVVGPMAAHILLPWTRRIFANLKTWVLSVYHRRI